VVKVGATAKVPQINLDVRNCHCLLKAYHNAREKKLTPRRHPNSLVMFMPVI
jgi:hypothetical protein